jgi:hypothetical protein
MPSVTIGFVVLPNDAPMSASNVVPVTPYRSDMP